MKKHRSLHAMLALVFVLGLSLSALACREKTLGDKLEDVGDELEDVGDELKDVIK